MKETLLGYLTVLGWKPVLDILTEEERIIGRESILGSLVKLEEYLEIADPSLLAIIKTREEINGMYPYGNKLLVQATSICAEAVYQFYKNEQKEANSC